MGGEGLVPRTYSLLSTYTLRTYVVFGTLCVSTVTLCPSRSCDLGSSMVWLFMK